jgi:hypothetical protein
VDVRRRLGLKEGVSDLLLEIDDSAISVSTRSQALARVQRWAAKLPHRPAGLASDDLIASRRREARRPAR